MIQVVLCCRAGCVRAWNRSSGDDGAENGAEAARGRREGECRACARCSGQYASRGRRGGAALETVLLDLVDVLLHVWAKVLRGQTHRRVCTSARTGGRAARGD